MAKMVGDNMRNKLIKMICILFIVLSAIFILKTVYLQANEFIFYQNFERLTGTIIASIISILVCFVTLITSVKKILIKKG